MLGPEEIAKETNAQFMERIRNKQKAQADAAAKKNAEAYALVDAIKKAIEKFTDDSSHWSLNSMEFKIHKVYTTEDEFEVYPLGDPEDVIFKGQLYHIQMAFYLLGSLARSGSLGDSGHIIVSWGEQRWYNGRKVE